MGCNILRRQLISTCSGLATFQEIISQKVDVGAQPFRRNLLQRVTNVFAEFLCQRVRRQCTQNEYAGGEGGNPYEQHDQGAPKNAGSRSQRNSLTAQSRLPP